MTSPWRGLLARPRGGRRLAYRSGPGSPPGAARRSGPHDGGPSDERVRRGSELRIRGRGRGRCRRRLRRGAGHRVGHRSRRCGVHDRARDGASRSGTRSAGAPAAQRGLRTHRGSVAGPAAGLVVARTGRLVAAADAPSEGRRAGCELHRTAARRPGRVRRARAAMGGRASADTEEALRRRRDHGDAAMAETMAAFTDACARQAAQAATSLIAESGG